MWREMASLLASLADTPPVLIFVGGVLLMKFMKSDSSKGTRRAVSEHASLNWGSDGLSEGYAGMTEWWPQHEHIYRYTMFKTLGDLKGKLVLDMPSGEGRFTEAMLRMGVAGVVAVDLAPKMLELTMERCKAAGLVESGGGSGTLQPRLCIVEADACKPMVGAAAVEPCDAICASFLFEYSTTRAELLQTAVNLFGSAKPGAPLCVIYVPGAKAKSNIAIVKKAVGIEATELTPSIKPGDPVVVNYVDKRQGTKPFSYTIRYWPVEMVAGVLREAGFVDVEVRRLELNPAFDNMTRGFDLEAFVKASGNRVLVGRRPS